MRKQTLSLAAIATGAALALSACGGVSTSTGGGSDSGDYPTGAVNMPVGASAGGSSDLISREVSKGLSDELGGSFPVINREGANGALAAAEVAKAEPDGSTISVQNASLFAITPLAVGEDEVTSIDDFDVVGASLATTTSWWPARAAASSRSTTSPTRTARSPTAPPVSAPAPSSPAR